MNRKQLQLKENFQLLKDSVPELHKKHPKWVQCIIYTDNTKWDKALDCLIEIAAASKYYFSERFWSIVSDSAQLLNKMDEAAFCQKQIDTLKRDKVTLPFGWTSKKQGKGTFVVHYAQKKQDEWNADRRHKDNIESLLNEEGFHFKRTGKTGYVYYVSQGRITEVEWHEGEIEGSTFSKFWIYPKKSLLTDEEFQEAYSALKQWAALESIPFRY